MSVVKLPRIYQIKPTEVAPPKLMDFVPGRIKNFMLKNIPVTVLMNPPYNTHLYLVGALCFVGKEDFLTPSTVEKPGDQKSRTSPLSYLREVFENLDFSSIFQNLFAKVLAVFRPVFSNKTENWDLCTPSRANVETILQPIIKRDMGFSVIH